MQSVNNRTQNLPEIAWEMTHRYYWHSNSHPSQWTDTISCRYALSFMGRCFCF